MPRQTSVVNVLEVQSKKIRGGRMRVARRFLPASPAAALIRIDQRSLRLARNRRRLARLIDPRYGMA